MPKKKDYAKMFTLRKNGLYQKFVNGKYLYSKDPEELYQKWQEALQGPKEKTFQEVLDLWSEKHSEEVTIRTWNNYEPHIKSIKQEHGDLKISEVTAQVIMQDLARAKSRGYSQTIVKTRKAIYSSSLDYALANDWIKYNPCASVKLPKGLPKSKRSAPTEFETTKIVQNITDPFGFFAFLLLCTGMRKGEALALTRSDIDLKNWEISVNKALTWINPAKPEIKNPKTENSRRNIPIVSCLRAPLKDYLENITGEILFPAPRSNRNPGGGYMTEKGYELAWSGYCDRTGINITAHQLRHGTATIMFEAGVDEYTAQKILGHANITTTMAIYTELRDKKRKKSIECFSNEIEKYIK